MKYQHFHKGKYMGEFEDSCYEEAVESLLSWHDIEINEVEE